MSGDPLEERPADTSDECCGMCEEVDGCDGFVYAGKTCYLKSNFVGTYFNQGRVTRLRADLGAGCPGFGAAEQDTDLDGELLDEWAASSPEACCASCAKKEECQGFTFFDLRCYLKKNVQGTYNNDGRLSRVKTVVPPLPTAGAVSSRGPFFLDRRYQNPEAWQGRAGGDCDADPASCACFVERDPNFCNTCPACGPCVGFCEGIAPTSAPTSAPTPAPTVAPTSAPTFAPTSAPTLAPTFAPTSAPTTAPTSAPTLAPTIAPPQCPQFEEELADTDMSGDPLEERPADTSDECCGMCEEVDGCDGFVYAGKTCYLKSNFVGTYFNQGRVTRLRADLGAGCPGFGAAEQDTDLDGELLDEWAASSPEACCASCAKKEECQGFTFFDLRCYLKNNVQGTYSNDGRLSRVKTVV